MPDDVKKEIDEAKKQAQHFGLDFVSLKDINIPFEVLNIIPEEVARKNELVVYKKDDKHLHIAVANPQKLKDKAPQILMDLKAKQGYTFSLAITTKDDLYYVLLGYKQKRDFLKNEKDKKMNIQDGDKNKVSDIVATDSIQKLGNIPDSVLLRFPKKIAQKYRMIVVEEKDNKDIKVAMEDPDNIQNQEILDFIAKRNNISIEKIKVPASDIEWGIKQYDLVKPEKSDKQTHEEETLENEDKPLQKTDNKKNIETKDLDIKIKPPVEKEKKDEQIKVISEIKQPENDDDLTLSAQPSSEDEQDLDRMFTEGVNNAHDLEMIVRSGSIPRMVAGFLYFAVKSEASDVHIEADSSSLRVRYRIDGILREIVKMPLTLQAPIISRIKIMAKLKIDEQRIPQDGRIDIKVQKREIDLRISTLPTIHGEKCVMRLLDKTTGIINLEDLGLIGENKKRIEEAIKKPYGIIFATGPTGSGKSTTLYAILNTLNDPKVNIVTLEDPVEYELSGINQCHVKAKIGFDFASGLRSILRQDPNIIMVGEVRDGETANMATHAALTGHLVLSTLHTNDSAGALPRLIDMGVEPFLITSSINAIIAQRLVRTLCNNCKKETQIPEKLFQEIKSALEIARDPEIKKVATDMKFYKPVGCDKCKDGFKGRVGLYEVLSITDRIEQLAVNRATSSVIKRAALNQGLVTLRQDGFAKAAKGVTSVDEIIRVTR